MQDTLIQLHQYIMVPDRIPFIIGAILLTAVIGMITGPLAANANPFFWRIYDLSLGKLGDRLDKIARKPGDLMFRGFVVTVLALLFAFFVGLILHGLAGREDFGIIEMLILSLCITSGAVWYALLKLYFVLEKKGNSKGAFLAISRSTRADLNTTDDFGITRTGIGFLATSFDKGLVAPAFWYLVGGLPVLLIYTALAALSWRFGKCGFTKGFGSIPMVLEKLMGLIPSLLSGFLLAAAGALTPSTKMHKSLLVWWAAKDKAPYEQGGISLSAMAWPLGITLGGPIVDITGSTLQNVWVGPEGVTAQITHHHLRRALYLHVVAHLLFIFVLLCTYVYAGKLF